MAFLNFGIMGIVFGLFGSLVLVSDILMVSSKKIINTTGDNSPFYKSIENDTKPKIAYRLNAIFGFSLLSLSYLCQALALFNAGTMRSDAVFISTVLPIIVIVILWFVKHKYIGIMFRDIDLQQNK